MFRSVFSRLTAVFVVIIVASFTILAFLITSIAGNYSFSAKEKTVSDIAASLSLFLDGNKTEWENTAGLSALLSVPIYDEDVFAFLTDPTGTIFCCDEKSSQERIGRAVPETVLSRVLDGEEYGKVTDLDGLLPQGSFAAARRISYGAVFVCSLNTSASELMTSLVRTIVLSTLWVLIAVLIAIFFVSEHTIGPIKTISRAAKQFAAGDWDVRVPAGGRDEIGELAAAFNSMAESLSNLEKMRRTFLGNLSHDLRTPMTTISGFVDGILDGTIPKDKEEHYLQIVSSETKRLSRLVSALLDLSRLQAGERKFTYTAFDICEMAREIIISFEQPIEAKRLDVEFFSDESSMKAYADKDAIHQVLYNICDNAVKFSDEGGKLCVRVFSSGKKIHVSVYNEGIGIPPEDLPFVFDRFYKGDKSRSLDKTGVGLGMFISRSVMEAHGETITVKSEYGKFCEFEFTVQQAKESRKKSS
ncbi:MAG: HAMP domain-containing protein [Clostridia bacterium]|nr:HAMP domain-containing protein [Clostridia bacterium]